MVKLVAAALIVDGQGRLLLSRRTAAQEMGGLWELPGGKLEAGEHPERTVVREIAEELDCEIVLSGVYDVLFHRYERFDVLMMTYVATLAPGATPRAKQVAEFAWVTAGELSGYPLLPADGPLAERISREGVPTGKPPLWG